MAINCIECNYIEPGIIPEDSHCVSLFFSGSFAREIVEHEKLSHAESIGKRAQYVARVEKALEKRSGCV